MKRILLAPLLAVAACRESDAPQSAWFLTPSTRLGESVLVVDRATHRVDVLRGRIGDDDEALAIAAYPRGGTPTSVGAHILATLSDFCLHVRADDLLIDSPTLSAPRVRISGSSQIAVLPDTASLVRIDNGDRRIYAARNGNVILIESSRGITIHTDAPEPSTFAAGSTVRAVGTSYLIVSPDGSDELITPTPSVDPEGQMAFVPERKSVRFFDAGGDAIAELPSASLEVQPGQRGLLITGRFDDGLDGVLDAPFSVLLPLRNHTLLVLTGSD